MQEIDYFDVVSRLVREHQELRMRIAEDVYPEGGTLCCPTCGHEQTFTAVDAARYMRVDWPTHCGGSMLCSYKKQRSDEAR